jgi:predicted  nucleic acid-binding Zn-ribbon protein
MSMPVGARRVAPPVNVETFPERFAPRSEVVLSVHETAAVSSMLRQAKGAIASLRQRVAALEAELDEARDRAHAAEERARAETASRAAENAVAKELEQNLADALARNEALEAEMTEALKEREQRLWSAEARAQESERRVSEALERAAAAEAREWEAKAHLARVRDALGD